MQHVSPNAYLVPLIFMLALYWMHGLLLGPVCSYCGGKRKHGENCPLKDK